MTILFAVLLVVLVTAFVLLPLVRGDGADGAERGSGRELWAREKAVAVLAILEADFDKATGKLSEGDYRILRSDYEGRALQAMDALEKIAPAAASAATSLASTLDGTQARFCGSCGKAFAGADAFCGSCGAPRPIS